MSLIFNDIELVKIVLVVLDHNIISYEWILTSSFFHNLTTNDPNSRGMCLIKIHQHLKCHENQA
jgi:hypothetical protein